MIDILVIAILAIFANYRISRLVSQDTILDGVREAINRKASDKKSSWYWIAEWMNCAHCVGVWFAFFIAIVLSLFYHWTILQGTLIGLAVAGGQSFLWSLVEEDE